MDQLVFLQDMAVVMAVSAVIILLCNRFHLPVVLGYIIAGLLIGPNTPPYALVKDLHSIHILSELGVIFLLFSIGLEFSLTKLMRVGFVAFFAATVEIVLMIWIGYTAGQAFGWSHMDSLFLGAILSISSTTIIAKVLIETKRIKEQFAQVILGILIIEDLLAIVIIALLSGAVTTGTFEIGAAAVEMAKVFAFMAGVLFLGFLLVPRLLRYLSRFDSAEMTVIPVLGLCFAVSLSAAWFGFSVALGAFLIGAVIAETQQVKDVIHKMEPIRDMFTAIFFVSVGMLIDPDVLTQYWIPILIITVVTVVGKLVSCSVATFLTGYNAETSLKVGLGLAQIGEFSFIIARLGESSNVTSPFIYPIAVAVSAITTLTTPFLMRNTVPITGFLLHITPKPLSMVMGFYTAWLRRLGEAPSRRKTVILKSLQYYAPRFLACVAAGLVLFFLVTGAQKRFHILPPDMYKIVLGLALFPLFIGLAYIFDRFLWNVVFLNLIRSGKESQDIDRVFHNTLRFMMAVVTGLVLFNIGSSFLPRLPLAIAVAGVIVAAGVYLWGSFGKVNERIEGMVRGIFDQDAGTRSSKIEATQMELVRLIHEEYPWDVKTEDFLLPYHETAANQLIRDLRLRSQTGATIVAIYRGEESIPNPAPDMRLMPGDVVLLMGDANQIKDGIQFLHQKTKEPAAAAKPREGVPKTASFEMPAGYGCIGRTLREVKLRRKTGATILGIQKEGLSINNPHPDTVLEAGDLLALFGSPEQLEAAQKYLKDPSP